MDGRKSQSRRVVLCAMLAAIMTALQAAMAALPNIEPVSLLVLVYALVFGRDVFYIIYTFVLLEGEYSAQDCACRPDELSTCSGEIERCHRLR